MDTQTAISALEAMAKNLSSSIEGTQAQLDAINIAIAQLKGVLVVQIEADQKQIAQLQEVAQPEALQG